MINEYLKAMFFVQFFICIVGDLNGLVATVYLIYKLFTSKSQHRNIFHIWFASVDAIFVPLGATKGKKEASQAMENFPKQVLYFT